MTIEMGNVWDRATESVSDNLAAILPIALLAIFLPASLTASIAPLAGQSIAAGVIVQLAGFALTLVALWGQLAIAALAIDAPDRAAAARRATARFLPALGVSLLLLVALVALIVPLPIVLGLAGYDLAAAMRGSEVEMSAGEAGVVALYLLVLIPLLLVLAVRLALVTPVVVAERVGLGAFRRSIALTRGIAWRIFGVLLLYGIVFGVALLAAKFVFGSVLELVAGGEGAVSVATVLTSVLVSAVQTAFAVLGTAFIAKLYVAARDRAPIVAKT